MASRFPALQSHNYRNYFSQTSHAQAPLSDLGEGIMQKAQYDSSAAATLNAVFTAVLYEQYNKEAQFAATLPTIDRSADFTNLDSQVPGKAFRAAHSPVPLQTHPEGGDIPEGETFAVETFEAMMKRSETVLEVSDLQQIRGAIEDAVARDEFAELQEQQLDLAIDRDALAAPALEADDPYDEVDTPTPLDRVIASSDEEENSTDVNATEYTDGALDYGTIDRSEDTWADSFVDFPSTGSPRQLTKTLMDSFIDGLVDYGSAREENIVLLTGRDSARVLSDIQQDAPGAEVRVDGSSGGREDAGDAAETVPGLPVTTRFRHYDGIPIIPNQTCPADSLSRIYALDMSTIRGEPKIAIENYADPYTEMAGRGQTQGYIAQGSYQEKVLFLLNHEVMVRDFGSLGKLTHLEE